MIKKGEEDFLWRICNLFSYFFTYFFVLFPVCHLTFSTAILYSFTLAAPLQFRFCLFFAILATVDDQTSRGLSSVSFDMPMTGVKMTLVMNFLWNFCSLLWWLTWIVWRLNLRCRHNVFVNLPQFFCSVFPGPSSPSHWWRHYTSSYAIFGVLQRQRNDKDEKLIEMRFLLRAFYAWKDIITEAAKPRKIFGRKNCVCFLWLYNDIV